MKKKTKESNKLFGAVEKLYPTKPVSRKEYRGGLLLMDLQKGGDFEDMQYRWFNKSAIMGDMIFPRKDYPVQFVFQLVGLREQMIEIG